MSGIRRHPPQLLPFISHPTKFITITLQLYQKMNEKQTDNFKRLYSIAFRYITLQLDYARLSAAEKITVLLSTIALYALIAIIGMITLVFISIGIGHLLSKTIAPYTAYLFVSAFYLLLLIMLLVFRKRLIFDPASRFISKLFLKTPEERHENE